MAARRALIRESDLRRWARISREEGVAIRGSIGSAGEVTIIVNPVGRTNDDYGGDLDQRLRDFASR